MSASDVVVDDKCAWAEESGRGLVKMPINRFHTMPGALS